MEPKRKFSKLFKVLNKKPHQTIVRYPVNLPFKCERELKALTNKN